MSYSSETQEMREAYDAWMESISSKTIKGKVSDFGAVIDYPKGCECGGDAVGASRHPEYCPKYENT